MTDSDRWKCALLLWLSWEDEPAELEKAHSAATALADVDLAYSTQRNMKRELVRDGWVEQVKKGKHFQLSITEKGQAHAIPMDEWPTATESTELPDLPVRFNGNGHKLPRDIYGKLMRMVNAGEVDLIAVPTATRTKVGYWDER